MLSVSVGCHTPAKNERVDLMPVGSSAGFRPLTCSFRPCPFQLSQRHKHSARQVLEGHPHRLPCHLPALVVAHLRPAAGNDASDRAVQAAEAEFHRFALPPRARVRQRRDQAPAPARHSALDFLLLSRRRGVGVVRSFEREGEGLEKRTVVRVPAGGKDGGREDGACELVDRVS